MRTTILYLAIFWPAFVLSQSEIVLEKEIESEPEDSLYAYVSVKVGDKISENKPETLVRYKSNGVSYLDEEPHKIYHDFMGVMSFLVKTNHDLETRYQPHVLLEFTGMTTYASNKVGFGFVDREDHFALGGFLGTYMRRVDSYTRDFASKSHPWNKGFLFGGYFQVEPEYFSFLLSSSIEEQNDYIKILLAWKMGKMIQSKIIPEGLRVEIVSETFLGTGLGLSYHVPRGNIAFSAAYLIPKRDEVTKQRIFDRFLAQGLNCEIEIVGF